LGSGPARLQRLRPIVEAAELEQIEGVEEHRLIVRLAVQLVEDGHAVAVAVDRLAVDDHVARPKGFQGLTDKRKLVRPVIRESQTLRRLVSDPHSEKTYSTVALRWSLSSEAGSLTVARPTSFVGSVRRG
jgi:hypothetical protein